jgi:hypothetical protein
MPKLPAAAESGTTRSTSGRCRVTDALATRRPGPDVDDLPDPAGSACQRCAAADPPDTAQPVSQSGTRYGSAACWPR